MTVRFDIAVLGRAREAAPVAAGAGAVLAGQTEGRAALVVAIGGRDGDVVVGRPSRAAARLCDRLTARDLAARAAGRVVWCAVDDAADVARAAAVGAPTVLAICRPREAWQDGLLDEAGLVLVVGETADPLTELVLADLDGRGLAAAVVPAPDGLGSLLARLGVGTTAVRRALGGLLAGASE